MDVVFAAVGVVCTKSVVVPSLLALVAVVWVLNLRQTAKFIRARADVRAAIEEKYGGSNRGVALITGANSGVGLQLAKDLARSGLVVVMGCRSPSRALAAQKEVMRAAPHARVELLRVDVSDLADVAAAAVELDERFGRVDLLFCNAGILPSSGLRWGVAARAVFTCSLGRFLETSRATENGHAFIANPVGLRTQAGFGLLFATHVLGHLSLVMRLKKLLESSPGGGRVVWTGSRSASNAPCVFDAADMQHVHGSEAYGASKFLVDLVNAALNDEWASSGAEVTSLVACPGAFTSGATPGLFSAVSPIMKPLRPLMPKNVHVETTRAALVLEKLSVVDVASIDPRRKYCVEDGELALARRGAYVCDAKQAKEALAYCTRELRTWMESHAAEVEAAAKARTS